jgi:L-glyceraldehyde 3-phosphate reductase
MLDRWVENGLLDALDEEGLGCIVFSPLAQGMLTGKYLNGIPADSRAGRDGRYLTKEKITQDKLDKIKLLNKIAADRGQSLTQMALSWVLRRKTVTGALIGASRPEQILENIEALSHLDFSQSELDSIDGLL